MIFHENRLLADDSHEISYLIFFLKMRKYVQNLWSAAVVIGVLRVNKSTAGMHHTRTKNIFKARTIHKSRAITQLKFMKT